MTIHTTVAEIYTRHHKCQPHGGAGRKRTKPRFLVIFEDVPLVFGLVLLAKEVLLVFEKDLVIFQGRFVLEEFLLVFDKGLAFSEDDVVTF